MTCYDCPRLPQGLKEKNTKEDCVLKPRRYSEGLCSYCLQGLVVHGSCIWWLFLVLRVLFVVIPIEIISVLLVPPSVLMIQSRTARVVEALLYIYWQNWVFLPINAARL